MKYLTLSNLRRLSQIVFLLLFVLLLLRTEFRGSLQARGDEIRLPYPVQLFFQLDPLVAVSNALASRALYQGLIWSLLVLIPTLFFGRFFCGWICPLGTLNHFFSSLKSETKRGKQLITSNRYKPWQKTKYYILIAVLVAALLGTGLVGWLDPFSLLVRSLGLSIFPGLNYAVNAGLNAAEHVGFAPLQIAASLLHWLLGALVLSFKQPHFRQGFFLGFYLYLPHGLEFSRHALLVPRHLSSGSAARRRLPLVDLGTAQRSRRMRQLQPLPALLSGWRRSHRRSPLAQGRMPSLSELHRRMSAAWPDVQVLPQQRGR